MDAAGAQGPTGPLVGQASWPHLADRAGRPRRQSAATAPEQGVDGRARQIARSQGRLVAYDRPTAAPGAAGSASGRAAAGDVDLARAAGPAAGRFVAGR